MKVTPFFMNVTPYPFCDPFFFFCFHAAVENIISLD